MRSPDVVIGEQYLHRWYLVPRNRWLNVYLHCFLGSDAAVLHDHPWWSVSVLLRGALLEQSKRPASHRDFYRFRWIPRWLPVVRSARCMHRLILADGPAWTLFITGPKVRPWGFLCPRGWRHWEKVTRDGGARLIGCGEVA